MGALEVTSLFSSIASVILSIVAIWLSIAFFRLSSQLSESTREAAKGIGASVERLEGLFDKLYSDTFSMMRDTVSDMRRHMWPEDTGTAETVPEEAEKGAEERTAALKAQIEEDLSKVLHRQRITDEKISSLSQEMRGLLERAITGSKRVEREAREVTIRARIMRAIMVIRTVNRRRGRREEVTAEQLVERLGSQLPVSRLVSELERMAEEGLVSLNEPRIGPQTEVTLRPRTGPGTHGAQEPT